MSEEKWMQELARVAEEDKAAEAVRLDERWDRLSAGRLSAEEEEELRTLAASSEEAGEAYELFRPFTPEVQARMLKALDEQEKELSPEPVPLPIPPSPPEEPKVLPFRPPRSRPWAWVSGAVAAAAAVLVVAVPSWINRPKPPAGPFPGYSGELAGYQVKQRSGPAEPEGTPTYQAGDQIRKLMTPPTAPGGEVEAECYFVQPQTVVPCAAGVLEVKKAGAIVIEGTVGEQVQLAPGEWQLCVVAGFRGRLPSSGERSALCAKESAPGSPENGYRIYRETLRIEPTTG